MRISDWSSDVCSSDLQTYRATGVPDGADPSSLRTQGLAGAARDRALLDHFGGAGSGRAGHVEGALSMRANVHRSEQAQRLDAIEGRIDPWLLLIFATLAAFGLVMVASRSVAVAEGRSEEQTYE